MIRGKIIVIGPMISGNRKTDGQPWKKQLFVLETEGQYSKKVAFYLMNDKIDNANIQIGHTVEIEADASSREYNGRWYTELTAWKVNNVGFTQPMEQPNVYKQSAPQGYSATSYQPDAAHSSAAPSPTYQGSATQTTSSNNDMPF